MDTYLMWIMWFIIAEALVFVADLIFRRRERRFSRLISAGIKFVLGVLFGFLVMAGPLQLRPVQPLMSALYVALLGDCVADLIFCTFQGKIRTKKLLIRKAIGIVLGIALLTYGTINMQTVKAVNLEYSSEKLINEYTFVFVSDMHVGSAQDFATTAKTIEAIKNENADFVVLGGDITDDYTTKEEMQNTYALFADFTMPVYYIYGNHDRQENAGYANGRQYTVEELEQTMAKNGIKVLHDDYITIGEDLVILGRADKSEGANRKSATELKTEDWASYFVIFDHQPTDNENFTVLGADLQLSGHTHAGQFFPLCIFNDLFLGNAYGEYTKGDATLYVSAGAAGWRVPCRTDAQCQYEVVHLTPNK